jgi:hypothetical protein
MPLYAAQPSECIIEPLRTTLFIIGAVLETTRLLVV